jgi:glycolate oxidase iron-sulfur subunit
MSARDSEAALALDPRTYRRGLSCVHCGLCLPACPTYTETGNEADSPRGRIQLMLGMADGKIDATDAVIHHLDLCLDCRACETACPSGVVYHELIEETRARLSSRTPLSLQGRFMRWMFFNVFVYPRRLKLALLPARLMQKIGLYSLLRKIGLFRLLPVQLRKMEQMLPERGSVWPTQLAVRVAPSGGAKARTTVAFFPGCIGSVMFEDVNRQAVELLVACGAEVIVPRAMGCCGAIHHHNGAHQQAEEFARANIDALMPRDGTAPDCIATCIAGCGAMLRDYDFLLRDDPEYAERAKAFAAKVRDISEVLLELGLPKPTKPLDLSITYHDACHLAHAQKVTTEPRALLSSIPGLTIRPLPESDMCCGAAGTYNLTQPEMATALAERKIRHIESTGADICVTGNVGCAMQIQSEARARGKRIKVLHPVELLHRAIIGG